MAMPGMGLRAGIGWLLLAVMVAVPACRSRNRGPLEHYVSDAGVLRAEFPRYAQRQMDAATAGRMENAEALARRGDYRGAIAIVSGEVPNANIPALHANLGVLYAAMGDYLNAQEQFQAALRLDSGYDAARQGIAQMDVRGLIEEIPVTHEVEPNNSLARYNTIAMNVPVTGEVANEGDVDAFRFKVPGGPRDLVEITVASRSGALVPYARLYDGDKRLLPANNREIDAASTLRHFFSPTPGATYYLELWGQNRTSGGYSLRVHPRRAYDAYEPNDDILHAARVGLGAGIDAGIMDANDSDFYQVTAAGGSLSITGERRSPTLDLVLTMYGPDRAIMGKPGELLPQTLATVAGQTYYVQVWGRLDSSGAYALTIK